MHLFTDPHLRIYLEPPGRKWNVGKELDTKCQLPCVSVRKQHAQPESLEDGLIQRVKQTKRRQLTKFGQRVERWQGTEQDCGASHENSWMPAGGQEKKQGVRSFQNLEGDAAWRGPPCDQPGEQMAHPHSPPSCWSLAGTSHSESERSQSQKSSLTKSIWARGEQWLCRDKRKISSTLCYF